MRNQDMPRVLTGTLLVLLSLFSLGCAKEEEEEVASGYVKMVNASGGNILYPVLSWPKGFSIMSNSQKSDGRGSPGPTGLTDNQVTFRNNSTSLFYVTGVKGAVVDFSFAYYTAARTLKTAEYKSAFAVGESSRDVITVRPEGAAIFSWEAMPTVTTGGGSKDCSGYNTWLRQCSSGGMAACYCATAVLSACAGDKAACMKNEGYAASLGTSCRAGC